MSTNNFLSRCTTDALIDAAHSIKDGALVAFPTETVYGLGADASNERAVARIYEVKGRPSDHPLIVHISSLDQLEFWVNEISEYSIALARNFWPGPMTIIFNRSDSAQDFITGGQSTIGIRIPNHPIALALLNECKKLGVIGIAAPSANRFGHVSATTSQSVIDELSEFLGPKDLVLDGGSSDIGLESTIIDCTGLAPRILRPGAISIEMIEAATGLKVASEGAEIRVSGSLEKHYAPEAKVILNSLALEGEGLIAMQNIPTPLGAIRLAEPNSIEEFARVLYSSLREADSRKIKIVKVMEPEGGGIAVAIRDRLLRASKGR